MEVPDDDPVDGFLWAAVMENGAIPFGVDEAGALRIHALGDSSFAVNEEAGFSDYEVAIVDPFDRVAFGIRRDGSIEARIRITDAHLLDIDTQRLCAPEGVVGVKGDLYDRVAISPSLDRVISTVGGVARPYLQRKDIASDTYLFSSAGKIEALWHSGQSNSAGAGDNGIINPVAPRPQHAIMLNTVGTVMGGNAVSGSTITDFVPARETARPGISESQGTALAAYLARKNRLLEEPADVYLYNSHGIGGKFLSELQQGSIAYGNGLTALNRAIAIAAAYGKQISVRSIFWTHGEGDAYIGTTQAAYMAGMHLLKDGYNTDYRALLPGDNGPISMIMDQLPASTVGLTGGAIALAQLALCKAGGGFYMSTPRYMLFASHQDGVHIRPIDRAVLGEYQAKAWRRIHQEGEAWKPLWPTSIVRTGNQIVINFHVPRGALQWDFSILAPARNYGFEYSDDSASATIENVAITGAAQVTLTLSGTPTGANKTVGYAYATQNMGYGTRPGGWGNLCDSDNEPSFVQPGRLLRNYCVTFRESIS